MNARRPAEPQFGRPALVPGILAGTIAIAGVGATDMWLTIVRFLVTILAVILCVYAVQAGRAWAIALLAVPIIWFNPVFPRDQWPLEIPDIVSLIALYVMPVILAGIGIWLRVPTPEDPDTARRRR